MDLVELITIIRDIALSQRGVASFTDGDVYDNLNSGEIKYGNVNAGLQNVTYEGNLATYTFVFYYSDRLCADDKNRNNIWSDGVRILQSIINTLVEEYRISIPEIIVYTPFQQKFFDNLAGQYATVDITVESILGLCSIDEMDEDEPEPPVPPAPPEPEYSGLTFTSSGNSTVGLEKLCTNQTLEYSFDTENWSGMTTATTVSLSDGQKVYMRGLLNTKGGSDSNYTQFKMTGKIAASGNINYIWDYQNPNKALINYCGYRMFRDCTALTSAPELPSTSLSDNCYSSMFRGCTNLKTAPVLPATTLVKFCYYYMFHGCNKLTTAPELNAPTLVQYCYNSMFSGCTQVNYIKCLATDISAYGCTSFWLEGVSQTGTFAKDPSMASWTRDYKGIPTGWTVVNNQ